MSDVESARSRAIEARELEEAREEARRSADALIALESERATELETVRHLEREVEELRDANREAHGTIQAMQSTRIWRIGAFYWRLRDGLRGKP